MLGGYPEYEKECTSKWKLEKRDGDIEIWEYFDGVDWDWKYAIKIKGEIRLVTSQSKGLNYYMIFNITKKLCGIDENPDIDD